MGKIVAISGGNLESTDSLNRFAIKLTGLVYKDNILDKIELTENVDINYKGG